MQCKQNMKKAEARALAGKLKIGISRKVFPPEKEIQEEEKKVEDLSEDEDKEKS